MKRGDVRTGAQALQDRLAGDILAGRLMPGTKLKLTEIGQTYGSGMSPLREALAGLSGQGLVYQEGQRGFRVAAISREDLEDVVNMRMQLEVMALRAAVSHGDVNWEGEILSSYHKLIRHKRTPEHLVDEHWEGLHRAFHLGLVRPCGSKRLFDYCSSLLSQFDRYRRIAALARKSHTILKPLDGKIVEATLDRDADTACGLLTEHIDESGKALIKLFSKSYGEWQ